jgi:hypothetical protein
LAVPHNQTSELARIEADKRKLGIDETLKEFLDKVGNPEQIEKFDKRIREKYSHAMLQPKKQTGTEG